MLPPLRSGRLWSDLSLARQFALAGGLVMFLASVVVGTFVSRRVEEIVVRNAANATALYMESFVAPLTQDLGRRDSLSATSQARLGALLAGTALGKRVVSFKIWRPDGRLVDASNTALVGQRFDVTENLKLAWQGEVRADFDETGDEEDVAENALGLPLLEIYSPIRDAQTGRVIAVAEFYEIATQLRTDLTRVRLASWGVVSLVMALIGASLFAIVLRGSRTIDRQMLALQDLSVRNVALRRRIQGAAARFSAMTDQERRRIGADLHDGPAQLMGFAALRLDALRRHLPEGPARDDLAAIDRAVKDSIREVRTISRGLSLPDIENRSIEDIVRGLAEAHATRTETDVAVRIDGSLPAALPLAVRLCMYRVLQEGLNNAWRHGDGKGQEVRLRLAGDRLDLSVLDRGPGLAEGSATTSVMDEGDGLGLPGLADRVESLGGQIVLRNRKDLSRGATGAELHMSLDLKEVA